MVPSRKIIRAILMTSMLWISLDMMLLSFYGLSSSENSQESSIKLPILNARAVETGHDGEEVAGELLQNLQNEQNKLVKEIADLQHRFQQIELNVNKNNDDKVIIPKRLEAQPPIPGVTTKSITRLPKKPIAGDDKVHIVQNLDVTSMPRDIHAPGEMGKPVETNVADKKKVDAGWLHASFNEFVSDMISLERALPDYRPNQCNSKLYSNTLPTTSIIICFTEESWTPLLRTVHSVINRSPPELVKEVILVDDFSQRDQYLKEPLDEYMKRFPKVKILRLQKREGLIRARLKGAEIATGDVLTFLDSHVECSVGWLEPLLQRIWQDRTIVVCPVIDAIDDKTFKYMKSNDLIGGFNWEMQFRWASVPDYERLRRTDGSTPLRSPTMAGGLFSIDKSYFYELGTYDPGLDIWGGENLELSFKIWMCGGSLEILPCSRVGHVFRSTQPYKFPKGNMETFLYNTQRVVEVWLDDEYKKIFYKLRPSLVNNDFGDISERLKFKKDKKCHDFDWYLKTVFPALAIPETEYQADGELRNVGVGKCMDTMGGKGAPSVLQCHGQGSNQHFMFSKTGRIIANGFDKCLGSWQHGLTIMFIQCLSEIKTLQFDHRQGGAMHVRKSGKCLDISENKIQVVLRQCNGSKNQQWRWHTYYDDEGNKI